MGKSGSIRLTLPDFFSDFGKTLGRKKGKASASASLSSISSTGSLGSNSTMTGSMNGAPSELPDKMRRMSIYQVWNPDLMPATSTRSEGGRTVIVRTMSEGKYQITAGTVEALVEALADESAPGAWEEGGENRGIIG